MEIDMSVINDDIFELNEIIYIANTLGQPLDNEGQ